MSSDLYASGSKHHP